MSVRAHKKKISLGHKKNNNWSSHKRRKEKVVMLANSSQAREYIKDIQTKTGWRARALERNRIMIKNGEIHSLCVYTVYKKIECDQAGEDR